MPNSIIDDNLFMNVVIESKTSTDEAISGEEMENVIYLQWIHEDIILIKVS